MLVSYLCLWPRCVRVCVTGKKQNEWGVCCCKCVNAHKHTYTVYNCWTVGACNQLPWSHAHIWSKSGLFFYQKHYKCDKIEYYTQNVMNMNTVCFMGTIVVYEQRSRTTIRLTKVKSKKVKKKKPTTTVNTTWGLKPLLQSATERLPCHTLPNSARHSRSCSSHREVFTKPTYRNRHAATDWCHRLDLLSFHHSSYSMSVYM